MIITEKVQVTIMYKNIEHYKSKGYKVKNLDKIEVPIEDIPTQSNIKIKVRCDYCGKEKYIKYQSYSKGTKFGKYKYACSTKCAWDKNRATNLERYGVEVVTQNKDVLNKCKNTILNKYGVDSISKTDYFKDKYKSTMKEKYGVENGFQLEEIKSKSRKTMIEKYGVEYNTQRETIKKQYLYGDKNYFYINGNGSSQEWNSPEAKRLKREIFKKYKRVCCICNKEKRKMIPILLLRSIMIAICIGLFGYATLMIFMDAEQDEEIRFLHDSIRPENKVSELKPASPLLEPAPMFSLQEMYHSWLL